MDFNQIVTQANRNGMLTVQPRMGFDCPDKMLNGLTAVKNANATTMGTITLDSYTRVDDIVNAQKSLDAGHILNGYPIINHGSRKCIDLLNTIQDDYFMVQVRHGSSLPNHIFECLVESGVMATEGGPISYCLPYSRTPLKDAVNSWRQCVNMAAIGGAFGPLHIESFGGCMLGQMCPPGLLVALAIIEGVFFERYGLTSLSLSYAQQTSVSQDIGAVRALRELATKWLKKAEWHVVVYTYMGVFPKTIEGATDLLKASVEICKYGHAERLITKTVKEAFRIPTIVENIASLERARKHWDSLGEYNSYKDSTLFFHEIYTEATNIISHVLNLDSDVGEAILKAFSLGIIDVPYCLHFDNKGKSRAYIDAAGILQWCDVGNMPIEIKQERGNQLIGSI